MNHVGRNLRITSTQAKIASLTITELAELSNSSTPPTSIYSSVGRMFIKRKSVEESIENLGRIIESTNTSIKDIEQKLSSLQKSKSSLQEATEKMIQVSSVSQ